MKKIFSLITAALLLVVSSCSKDYSRDLVGRWNAGKATLNSDIMVTIRDNGTLTAQITNTEMKPADASYLVRKDRLTIVFPRYSLSYKILSLDDKKLVMRSRFGRITWTRLK
ncbi:MAG: hypothetical protein JW807_04175 [Spirochaetes bacterium]|nr:hypothetical protein [Spirochaetota bacterium]